MIKLFFILKNTRKKICKNYLQIKNNPKNIENFLLFALLVLLQYEILNYLKFF